MHNSIPPTYSAKVVQLVWLKDAISTVQIALPANRLIDLKQLQNAQGRDFVALNSDDIKTLKKRNLNAFPLFPQANMVESWIDARLLEQDSLFFQDENQQWQEVNQEEFEKLASRSRLGDFSEALFLDIHNLTPEQDAEQVNSTIKQFTLLRIKQRLAETLDLPPLPEIANRIIELRADPNATTQQLAHAIELDPSLAAQVINWASSPFYGLRGSIKTVEDAVVRVLGFDLVINLALGLALGRHFSVPKDGPHGYTPFWKQATITALLSHKLIMRMPSRARPNAGAAYLSGLLHNFGFLLLGHIFKPQFELVNRHIEANPHINRMYLEYYLMGVTREQIASLLFQQWRLPDEVTTAIRQQHNPRYEGKHELYAYLLYVATRALRAHGIGDGPAEPIEDYLLDLLYLNQNTVHEVCDELLTQEYGLLIG